jgi:flagellar hook-basal body complex protein FliE
VIEKMGLWTKPPVTPAQPKAPSDTGAVDVAKSFGSFLNDAMNQVQEQQAAVDSLNQKFITGEVADVHKLMIAAEKASLGLELTVQIRNKAIEAYQEIMRTQI